MFKNEKTSENIAQNIEVFQAFLFPLIFSSLFFCGGFSEPKIFIYGSIVVGILCLISVILPSILNNYRKSS